jgi:hypothetical protein
MLNWSKNIEQGVLVNGSVGKVIEFLTTREAKDREITVAMPALPSNDNLHLINNHQFTSKERWPMVRFTNGRELLCAPVTFTVEGFKGNIEAHRLQVPLILAWALSIHKSQGQTLARVRVDLGQIFEKGQGKYSFLEICLCCLCHSHHASVCCAFKGDQSRRPRDQAFSTIKVSFMPSKSWMIFMDEF